MVKYNNIYIQIHYIKTHIRICIVTLKNYNIKKDSNIYPNFIEIVFLFMGIDILKLNMKSLHMHSPKHIRRHFYAT